ncbi:hypothetical protein KFL_000580360 [Klebsormidium nitens]|uniref:Chromo domain-containing protein n=1 Tax=Klebsormidium nitens TaxID=105231 RepID=A0A1Y1HUH3_KLENI|nr:hypothetical protein KFL_000580360 [Klebsormidium nitens]|eukprot:GAQ80641.1 hypothetical protein KFL_000580360 [Klebsormidium nitens]
MNPSKKQRSADKAIAQDSVSIDSLAAPLTLLGFALLLDSMKLYPASFPERPHVIASVINRALPPSEQVGHVAVFNIIQKLKTLEGPSALDAAACLKRPCIQQLAAEADSLHVAIPRTNVCLRCNTQLRWADSPQRPFIFPESGKPARGIVHDKVCKDCGILFSVGFYTLQASGVRRPYPASADHERWIQVSGETSISKGLMRAHDQNLYHNHVTFAGAVRAHNDLWGLDRFSEAPEAALETMRWRRSLRGSLHREIFERTYLQYWAIRFCQDGCPSLLDEIDLRWPVDRILSLLNDPIWCQLRDEALAHSKQCKDPLCGQYDHLDGNAKVFRDCCRQKDVEQFTTAIGRVVKGCPSTPVKGKKLCQAHLAAVHLAEPNSAGASDAAEGEAESTGAEINLMTDSDDEPDELDLEETQPEQRQKETVSAARAAPAGQAWDTETAPVALRTRGKQRVLQQDDIYEVERIEMHRIKNGVPIYLVKWKGYPSTENTWETEENLTAVTRDVLDEYLNSQPQGDFYTRDRKDLEPDPAPVDDATGSAPTKSKKAVACTPRTASDGRGVTAGTVVAFWVCGYMFPPLELILSESTTMVHHYFLQLFAFAKMPRFVGMDDMCHWARFAASGDRPTLCAKTREFVQNVTKVVDKFHFKKNHVGR